MTVIKITVDNLFHTVQQNYKKVLTSDSCSYILGTRLKERNHMTVKELIKKLQQIEDTTLSVRVIEEKDNGRPNYWLNNIDISDTGETGYELHGEVRLIGKE